MSVGAFVNIKGGKYGGKKKKYFCQSTLCHPLPETLQITLLQMGSIAIAR